jgi:hypothetical protein
MNGQSRTDKRTNHKRHRHRFGICVIYLLLVYLSLLPIACAFAEDPDLPWLLPTPKDYPRIRTAGTRVADFVPRGWTIMGQASGSLKDGLSKDVVLVLKNNKRKFKYKDRDFGEFDTNPRMLVILFRDSTTGAYRLAERSDTIIPIPDCPTMLEPFVGISIRNRILCLKTQNWSSAGSWHCLQSSYKFRWQGNKFVLIGAEETDLWRSSGEESVCSYNFLTGKVKVTSGYFANQAGARWYRLLVKKPKPLSSFRRVYEWRTLGEYE